LYCSQDLTCVSDSGPYYRISEVQAALWNRRRKTARGVARLPLTHSSSSGAALPRGPCDVAGLRRWGGRAPRGQSPAPAKLATVTTLKVGESGTTTIYIQTRRHNNPLRPLNIFLILIIVTLETISVVQLCIDPYTRLRNNKQSWSDSHLSSPVPSPSRKTLTSRPSSLRCLWPRRSLYSEER
jgi:hypothetical protein